MIENMKKICIIGGSGTGKTTLTNNLEKKLKLPVCHIDGLNYSDNWVEKDREERDKIILSKIKEDKWIIEGTYKTTLKERFEKAELIIYLDYSSIAQVKGVLGRFFKNHGQEKPEIPGCKERMSWEFLIWVWNWRKSKRQLVIDNLEGINKDKVIIFKNRRQLNKWYRKEFGEKIDTKA